MSDYRQVTQALSTGAEPALICATCPWDRNCINPPAMTAAEVQQQMRDMEEKAAESAASGDARKAEGGLAMAIMTTLVYGGKDTALQACPVLCARLKSSAGRQIAETVRQAMQSWDDSK